MYAKKAVYFNYKKFSSIVFFLIIPALLVLMGGSITASFFSLWPLVIGIAAGAVLAFPGLPRLMAINANSDLKSDKYKKALKRTKKAVRLPFAPEIVSIFHAYVLILNSDAAGARDILGNVHMDKLSYSEKAKFDATIALADLLSGRNPAEIIKDLEEKNRRGADESILYVYGKLMNMIGETADARKHNERAYDDNVGNRDILSNLVISYCRTGQDRDAKIMFRTLYNDMAPTSDALYYMAKIKEKENKRKDAASFIEAALDIEASGVDIVDREGLDAFLQELRRGAL